VPQSAVQQSSQGAYVWVADENNRVHSRTVTPGFWNGPNWVINDGLNAGERVVVSNVLRMSPNQLVKPTSVKAPEPQPLKLPTPPAATTDVVSTPFNPGASTPSHVNQAQNPSQLNMPATPANKLTAPKEEPLAPGVPTAPAAVPNSLQAPATRAVQ
jgi:hypothetical protein